MRLIDADALKAVFAQKYDGAFAETVMHHIDAMPDAGQQMRDVLDGLEVAREKYLLEVGYPQNKLEWADGVEEAVDAMRAVVGEGE